MSRKKPEEFYKHKTTDEYVSKKYLLVIVLLFLLYITTDYIIYHSNLIKSAKYCPIKELYEPANKTQEIIVETDVYLISSKKYPVEYTDIEILSIFNETNRIWGVYGIMFNVSSINKHNVSDRLAFLGKSGNVDNDAELMGMITARNKFFDQTIDVFFINKFSISIEGKRIDKEGVNTAVVSSQSKNIPWVIAHELGHVLNNFDESEASGKFTLMIERGCVKEHYYPTILNQTQLDLVFRKLPQIAHVNLTSQR